MRYGIMNSLPGNRRHTETDSLPETLGNLLQDVQQKAAAARSKFRFPDPDAQRSCDNLLAYLTLREHDLQDLQLELAERGLYSTASGRSWRMWESNRQTLLLWSPTLHRHNPYYRDVAPCYWGGLARIITLASW
jgi:hypothetical protein